MAAQSTFSFFFLLLPFLFFPINHSLKITSCDCSHTVTKGILQTDEPEYCKSARTKQKTQTIDYELYAKSPATTQWSAVACTSWIESQEKKAFFFGGTDTTTHKFDRQVTPEECAMSARYPYMCDKNKMTQTSSKTYKFIRIPEADYTWMHTNTANATCCVTQVITVKQACPTCNIQTPFGEINTTLFNSNFAYIGGTTIVWEAKPPEPKKCEYVKIHKGTGNLRSHVYTGRLSDQLYQLEYIFDFKQAHIPCPEITLNFTDIHLVQGISDTFIAFNNHSKFKTNKTKRSIDDDTIEEPENLMTNLLIRPYISSFHCLTQENTTFTLTPCVKFLQNETDPIIKNLKASNYSQNFKISKEGLINKIDSGLCMDYSMTEKTLVRSACSKSQWIIQRVTPYGYPAYTLEYKSTGQCLADIYFILKPCNKTDTTQHWLLDCQTLEGCILEKRKEAPQYDMLLRPAPMISQPPPNSLTELDNRQVLFIGQLISKFRIHNCINTYMAPGRQSILSLKFCFTLAELANATHTQFHKQSVALLEDGILRFTEVQNSCLNKSLAIVPCVQYESDSPITRWYYDPDSYQFKTEDQCLTYNIFKPTDFVSLTPCNNTAQQKWIFTNQAISPFTIGSQEMVEALSPGIRKLLRNQVLDDKEKSDDPSEVRSYKSRQFPDTEKDKHYISWPSAEKEGMNVTFLTMEGAEFLFLKNRQFIEGKTTDEVNILANEIRDVYCEVKRAMRGTILTLSSLDGILAAKIMKLGTCDRITSDGEMSILQTCEKREIEVEIKETKCGPQIIYTDPIKNISYGIAKNGYQLVPYSSCLVQHGMVGLNGKFYDLKTGEFIEISPNIHLNALHLIEFFEELDIRQYDITSIFQERYEHFNNERLDILTSMVSTLRESQVESIAHLILQKQTKNNIISSISWWDYVLYTLIVIAIIVLSTIAFKIYYFINSNPILKKILCLCCTCKKKTKPKVKITTSPIEMKPLTSPSSKKKKEQHDHTSVSFINGRAIWNDGCAITTT